MSFTSEEKEEIKMLVEKRQAEIQVEQNSSSHSNQQILDQEVDLLMGIVDKLDAMTGGKRRRTNRKTRKGSRKNRKASRKNRKD